MNYAFVLMHGWGSTGDYWQNLTPLLQDNDYFICELGYFNNITPTSSQDLQNFIDSHQGDKIIGIGHSVGFIKLLEQNVNFDYVFGVQSFVNFLPIEQMQTNFSDFVEQCKDDPIKTLTELYQRSDIYDYFAKYLENDGEHVNAALVVQDLQDLAINKSYLLDKIQNNYYIFGTEDDVAVPPLTINNNFPKDHVKFLDVEAGHGLGIKYADLLANEIFAVLKNLEKN